MDCSRFETSLNDYFDGALGRGEAAQFAAHALQCRACRALLDEVKAALAVDGEEFDTPPGLDDSLFRIQMEEAAADCGGFEDLITEFLDGYVPAPAYHRFESHAGECGRCSALLTEVVYAVAACHLVHTYEEVAVPAALDEKLLAIAEAERRPRRATLGQRVTALVARLLGRRPSRTGWSLVTAGLLAALSLTLFYLDYPEERPMRTIRREAEIKAARLYNTGADIYAQTDHMVARLERVGESLGEIWHTLGGDERDSRRKAAREADGAPPR